MKIKNIFLLSSLLLIGSTILMADQTLKFSCPQIYGVQSPEEDRLFMPLTYLADIDQDGFTDYAILGDKDIAKNISAGNLRVYSGKTGRRIYTAYAPAGLGNSFGKHLVRSSDLNGDGIPELLVSVSDSGGYPEDTPGKILIYSGKNGQLLHTITGPKVGEDFGDTSLASVDLTGDGKAEILVGAGTVRHPNDPHTNIGRVYIYSGNNYQLLTNWDAVGNDYYLFPNELIPIKDLNGDGIAEIVGGGWTAGSNYQGLVRVWSGKTGVVLVTFKGVARDTGLGHSLADLGDLNQDGINDLGIINYPLQSNAQKLQILSGAHIGRGELLQIEQLDLDLNNNNSDAKCRFGDYKSFDVDGDDYNDFLIGCSSSTTSHLWARNGEILLISGYDYAVIYSDAGNGAYAGLGIASALIPNFGHKDYYGIIASRDTELADNRGSFRVYGLSHDNNNNGLMDVCEAVNQTSGGTDKPADKPSNKPDNSNNDLKKLSDDWINLLKNKISMALSYERLLLKPIFSNTKLERIRKRRGEQAFLRRKKLNNQIKQARVSFKSEIEVAIKAYPKQPTQNASTTAMQLVTAIKEYNAGVGSTTWVNSKPRIKNALQQLKAIHNSI